MGVIARNEITLVGVSDGSPGAAGKDGQMLYANCSTATTTAAKVATISSGTLTLTTGATVSVKFTYANTASSPTLNINNTGAKPIYTNGVRYAYWEVGATVTFTYDGTNWNVCSAAVYGNTATIGNPAGGNLFIDGDSVDIRQGSAVLASFANNSDSSDEYFGANITTDYSRPLILATKSEEITGSTYAGRLKLTSAGTYFGAEISCPGASVFARAGDTSNIYDGTVVGIDADNIIFNGSALDDYVVAEGTSGIWRYRKWASGIAECWGARELTVSVTTKWYTLYYGAFDRVNYPFTFDGAPNEYITVNGASGNLWAALGSNTQTQTHNGFVLTVGNDTYHFWLEYYAIGKYIVQ